eukprot:5140-Heterococcus_DN1.PRE.3
MCKYRAEPATAKVLALIAAVQQTCMLVCAHQQCWLCQSTVLSEYCCAEHCAVPACCYAAAEQ